jgi:hypothetical protein
MFKKNLIHENANRIDEGIVGFQRFDQKFVGFEADFFRKIKFFYYLLNLFSKRRKFF